jgi:hypothetical protein
MAYDAHPIRKVVLNRSVGAFSLSAVAINEILSRKGDVVDLRVLQMNSIKTYRQMRRPLLISDKLMIDRYDPVLVSIVEEFGSLASGAEAELAVVIIPWNLEWAIGDVCGIEFISAGEKVWPLKETDKCASSEPFGQRSL